MTWYRNSRVQRHRGVFIPVIGLNNGNIVKPAITIIIPNVLSLLVMSLFLQFSFAANRGDVYLSQ